MDEVVMPLYYFFLLYVPLYTDKLLETGSLQRQNTQPYTYMQGYSKLMQRRKANQYAAKQMFLPQHKLLGFYKESYVLNFLS